jgi:outer membrane biosynthesis protein TonB
MKLFFNLFGMAMAGVLGYLAEPSLRHQLTGQSPSEVERGTHGKLIFQYQDGTRFDPADLAADQLPDQVRVDIPVKVKNAANGNTMTVDGGNRVRLLRIEAANAVVSPADGFEGSVPILRTDLANQLAANPPAKRAAAAETPDTVPAPDPVKPPEAMETPTPEPVPEVVPEPEPAPVPEPAVTPEPATEPAPAPAPETEKTPAPTAGGDPVAAMKASIQAGQIKEFTGDQVQEWKAGEDEQVDGETYQTGLASYKAETIFGVKTIQAKALIKNGKVQRWIWPKSGMEIK